MILEEKILDFDLSVPNNKNKNYQDFTIATINKNIFDSSVSNNKILELGNYSGVAANAAIANPGDANAANTAFDSSKANFDVNNISLNLYSLQVTKDIPITIFDKLKIELGFDNLDLTNIPDSQTTSQKQNYSLGLFTFFNYKNNFLNGRIYKDENNSNKLEIDYTGGNKDCIFDISSITAPISVIKITLNFNDKKIELEINTTPINQILQPNLENFQKIINFSKNYEIFQNLSDATLTQSDIVYDKTNGGVIKFNKLINDVPFGLILGYNMINSEYSMPIGIKTQKILNFTLTNISTVYNKIDLIHKLNDINKEYEMLMAKKEKHLEENRKNAVIKQGLKYQKQSLDFYYKYNKRLIVTLRVIHSILVIIIFISIVVRIGNKFSK